MSPETHSQLANFIWSICNLLRSAYKRNEYRKVILQLTVLRRFDALLAPTKPAVLEKHRQIKSKPETVIRRLLEEISGQRFFNLSKMQFVKEGHHSLLDDPNNLAPNLISYINAFSPNVRAIGNSYLIVRIKKPGDYTDRLCTKDHQLGLLSLWLNKGLCFVRCSFILTSVT